MRRKEDLQFDEFVADSVASSELEYLELPISQRVFLLVIITSALIGLIVLGRVGYLNVVRSDFYTARSAANINRDVSIPAYRGLIVDRFDKILATNAETFSVFLDVPNLLKNRADLDAALILLSESLMVPLDDLYATLEAADFEIKSSVALVRNISAEMAIAVRGLGLPSVRVENDYRREYPNAEYFSHVVGYTGVAEKGSAIIGKSGLERFYDEQLRGVDGITLSQRDANGAVIDERVTAKPVSGSELVTTIDAEFQSYFYDRLAEGLRNLGLKAGVGIALDPRNGEVLALLNIPSFDSNVFVTPGSNKEISSLFNDASRPLFNRAVSGTYNPASTIKPLVASAALKEGVVSPDDQILSIGYIEIPNPYNPDKPSRFADWKAHGLVDVRSALARSSNVYFYEVGGGFPVSDGSGQRELVGLGIERLRRAWQDFGLGVKTGINLDFEASGFLPAPEEKEERTGQPWRIGDTYNVSIGQGDLLVTPLQLINYIATIANGGTRYQPTLMKNIKSVDGEVVAESYPVILQEYPEYTSAFEQVRKGMEDGVGKEYGTSHLLAALPVKIAAKTGSAQTNNNTKTNAFFIGYMPADNPQIVISILVENAKEGSLNAIPIARDVFAWYYENRLRNTN
ncbi:MAG: penicillin-binding protein 2 [bacterium]|nr:penicillin-binding protein 2 [bacterium]